MAVETGFQGRTVDVQEPRTSGPRTAHPGATADAVFADAKAFLSSSEARQMSESELERELHRRGQRLVRKLLQEHHDQRSPGETAGPAEDASGAEDSEPCVQESHTETTSRARYHGLHPLDAASNPPPECNLFEMRRVTIATASRAPPRTAREATVALDIIHIAAARQRAGRHAVRDWRSSSRHGQAASLMRLRPPRSAREYQRPPQWSVAARAPSDTGHLRRFRRFLTTTTR